MAGTCCRPFTGESGIFRLGFRGLKAARSQTLFDLILRVLFRRWEPLTLLSAPDAGRIGGGERWERRKGVQVRGSDEMLPWWGVQTTGGRRVDRANESENEVGLFSTGRWEHIPW